MGNPLFATKSMDTLMKEAGETGEHSLKRALGPVNLITLGIGAIIGAGIFVLTGSAAALYAGPAIMLSYVLAGLGCVFAGLCYAEFASMIPIAGSAYTYGYATLGEIVAWIIGWDLILEYAFGAATVASGWSSTLVAFLQDYGINLPPQICDVPGAKWVMVDGRWAPETTFNLPAAQLAALPHATASFNLIAFLAILGVTTILIIGIKESANFNTGIVFVKLAAVLTFIAVAIPFVLKHPAMAHDELESIPAAEHRNFWLLWMVGNVARGRRRLLRLYRIRCRFDGGARGPQSAEGYAHRHTWFTGGLHHSLPRGFRAIDGNGALLAAEYRCAGLTGHSRNGGEVGQLRGQRRCAGRPKHSDAGDAAGPIARLLFDGARRSALEVGGRYSSAVPDPVEVHGNCRAGSGHCGLAGADRRSRTDW